MTKDVFQAIKKSKADFTQVNFSNVLSKQILFEKQKIKDFSGVLSNYVSVSVWIGKKHGVATATTFSEDLVKKAIEIAKVSEDLDFFYGLPKTVKTSFVKGLDGGEKTEEELIDSAEALVIDLNKGEIMPEASFEYSNFNNRIVNSLGVDLEEKSSLFSTSIGYILKGREMVSHSDSLSLRKIPSKDKIKDFSKKVLDETRELKNPRKLDNLPDIVILSRTVVAQLLESVFLSNFDGLNVLKKKSILEGKEGEKLFSDNFNLTDSGVLDEGFGSQSFDMEGIPSQETLLVKEGVLKSFLYDYNTAKHLNKESTGNSVGGGVGLNNILVGKGEGINLDKAIIIKDIIGAHTGNELTTEFSVKSSGTLLLEKGQKKAIKDVMINGKMIDMLNNIVGIGKKIRNVGNFYLPRMAFKSMNVSNL